ncbi:hypothetical protein TIFTF001_004190 [Ficus carica]|uniref:Uncharacterized protein n=1 Tax=Ficus carica TaxID=3494 RepID=A0AA88CXB4_FICCA|nr:hypothetical protein TIFTF001_004190 [Ficus carica]
MSRVRRSDHAAAQLETRSGTTRGQNLSLRRRRLQRQAVREGRVQGNNKGKVSLVVNYGRDDGKLFPTKIKREGGTEIPVVGEGRRAVRSSTASSDFSAREALSKAALTMISDEN